MSLQVLSKMLNIAHLYMALCPPLQGPLYREPRSFLGTARELAARTQALALQRSWRGLGELALGVASEAHFWWGLGLGLF